MVFIIPFDMLGPMLDWAFEHAPATSAGVVLVACIIWFAVWISGYARRFKHVEADVSVLKQDMIVVNNRLDRIDVKLKGIKRKFKDVDDRLDRLEKRIDSKFDALDQKFTALLTQLSLNNKRKER